MISKKALSGMFTVLVGAIIMIVVIVVVITISSGSATASGKGIMDVFNGIPGIPEKAPVLETGAKLAGEPCRFSYECASGFACWKGNNGGSGLGRCVKWIEPPVMLIINGKQVPAGVCYENVDTLIEKWINTGKIPRESWNIFSAGIYVVESGNDVIYVSGNKKNPRIEPSVIAPSTVLSVLIKPSANEDSELKIASDRTYVLKAFSDVAPNGLKLYGGFNDKDCEINNNYGYNSIVFYKIADKCTMNSCAYNG